MEWISGFFVPLIKVIVYLGFFGVICFFVGKAYWNLWNKKLKFIWKYKFKKNPYPENKIEVIMASIDNKVSRLQFKKQVYIHMGDQEEIDEYMWLYDKILKELNIKEVK